MLDFGKIQFSDLSKNALNFQPKQHILVQQVIKYLKSTTSAKLQESLEGAGEKKFAIPIEEPHKSFLINENRKLAYPYTAVGTDGSQILPDRHENLLCFVLNMGWAIIEYGQHAYAKLANKPSIYYKPEDLFVQVSVIEGGSRRFLAPRWYLDGLRDANELLTLKNQLTIVKNNLIQKKHLHPLIGFVDGNLIRWQVQKIFKKGDIVNTRLEELVQYSKNEEVPIFGYISKPRSSDIIQLIAWEYERENIESLSIEGDLDLITDVDLFSQILTEPQTRSAMFRTQKTVTEKSDQHIVFCYLNTGVEIVRIEFPEWVVEKKKFSDYFPYILDQVTKGQGYPICLLEAHHQAEVSGREREAFYTYLKEVLAKSGIAVSNSAKLLSKKHRFV